MARRLTHYKLRLIGFILLTFVIFTLIQVVFKPAFMLYNNKVYGDCGFSDYLNVIGHGLPMDFSVAGYLTVIPGLIIVLSAWFKVSIIKMLQQTYFFIAALILAFIHLVDMVLYDFWGFRLDTTPVFYFLSSPKDALASVSLWFVLGGFLAFLLIAFLLFIVLKRTLMRIPEGRGYVGDRILASLVCLLVTGALILPIRGGITTSTMNIGRVYFSSVQQMNHAAINPVFSLIHSFINTAHVEEQYRFMDDEQASKLFDTLLDKTTTVGDSAVYRVLKTERPNVVVIVLESFSAKIMKTMGGLAHVAVNMDRYAQEGILFTNFYANSFRTDRGLASIIAGYPAQPTMSIMKYTDKTESLPMFPKVMQKAGYDLQYYYGGDADFTNMRSFLTTAGFEKIVADKDFDVRQRLSKWGVHDEYVFDKALADIRQHHGQPYLKIIQTSSSHEPFEVPFKEHDDKVLNAFAYTDDCLGKFVEALRKLPSWDKTLVVLVPDHLGCYPENIDNYTFERYHIPLILMGGAVKGGGKIPFYGSQIDIAATLLSQLRLSYADFTFSKDLLNPNVPHFAFATVPNAFAMITEDNAVFYNCETNQVITDKGKKIGKNLPYGKAYLQKLYDDISKR